MNHQTIADTAGGPLSSAAPSRSTIKLFLADGTPQGLIIAEIINWTGQALAAPRSSAARLLQRSEATRTGIYILMGRRRSSSSAWSSWSPRTRRAGQSANARDGDDGQQPDVSIDRSRSWPSTRAASGASTSWSSSRSCRPWSGIRWKSSSRWCARPGEADNVADRLRNHLRTDSAARHIGPTSPHS
jgi:hypothetical protein